MKPEFSFVIPVYNRPQEIKELLECFASLQFSHPYEIVIVEDGSTVCCKDVVNNFTEKLNISYYSKPNSGPGDSRNFGMNKAKGTYFIILDSDVLLPPHYLTTVAEFLEKKFVHCFGGADAAHPSFNKLQKAINYTMTAFLTTGGIRGSETSNSRFEPRSFNMGISREAFLSTGGFARIHPGEDPDLAHRIKHASYRTAFIPNAFVYHKRRISWRKFYKQVHKFGMVRPILTKWHPHSGRITFWFPTLFIFFTLTSIVTSIWIHWLCMVPLFLYLFVLCCDSALRNKSLSIGILTVVAVFVQFFGYGTGFLKSTILVGWLNKEPEKQFPQLFFK